MTLANLLMTAYVNNGAADGSKVWDRMETVAREKFEDELYHCAAGLLDRDTIVSDDNEYERGMVELIMEITGKSSDDKEAIADRISELTHVYYEVKLSDFGYGANGDRLYIGPLEPAVAFIKHTCEWFTTETVSGMVRVDLDGGNCWGHGDTEELAWRYAIAAELGPTEGIDFEPFRLSTWDRSR